MSGNTGWAELKELVGPDRFFDDLQTRERYSVDHSFTPARMPSCVLRPKDTGEITRIVRFANEESIPIIPHSSGFPKFHGDTVPKIGGIAMDLSGMKEVIRIDRRNRLAVIEPGVTFGELKSALQEQDMIPYLPLVPRSSKSVLASYLEREPITVPKDHWDPQDPILAGEIVFGNGEVCRTGGAAQGTRERIKNGEVIPANPMGPGQVDLMRLIQGSQGTLGILSWASVRCRLRPSIQKPFFVASDELDRLIPLAYRLLNHRLGEELFLLNGVFLAILLAEGPERIKRLQGSLPPWVLFLNIAGYKRYPEDKVRYKEEQVKAAVLDYGLELEPAIDGVRAEELLGILWTISEKDRRLRYKGSCQDLQCLTTLDKTPGIVDSIHSACNHYRYPTADVGIYLQPVVQGCHCHCEFDFPYEPGRSVEREAVRALFQDAAWRLACGQASFNRPYGVLAEITYNRDAAVSGALKRVKALFDPNRVMNPGKLCF